MTLIQLSSCFLRLFISSSYLISSIKQLDILSYKETLKRGFAVIKKKNMIIKKTTQVKVGDELSVEFFKDEMRVKKIK